MSSSEVHQRAFAARLRDPAGAPLPERVPVQRVAVYERLFYNSIESFISGTFPVLHGLLSGERWRVLVREFIARHRCDSPYFLDIGQEFIGWLQCGYVPAEGDPPYLLDLAHYEWLELALDTAMDELPAKTQPQEAETLSSPLQVSALARAHAYRWPVHRIGIDFQPVEAPAQPTFLLVWRDRRDKVRFMQLTAFTYQLLAQLQQQPQTPDSLLRRVAQDAGMVCDGTFLNQGRALIDEWLAQDILLSVTPAQLT
ncbi:MAG: putative DNA-binding domain-containing protein [Halopseudomonas sp.]|uniref:HvfC family RiPP maturation protein n=1 Tax=Halopseudomonas sp. TaxID=2901191 RepID=UPI003001BEE9